MVMEIRQSKVEVFLPSHAVASCWLTFELDGRNGVEKHDGIVV